MENIRLTKEISDSSDDEASSSDRAEGKEELPVFTSRDGSGGVITESYHVAEQELASFTSILPEASVDALNLQASLTLKTNDAESSGEESDVESEAESVKTTGTTARSYISQADRRPPSPYDGIVRLPVDTSPIVKDDFRILSDIALTKVGSVRNILENVVVIQAVDPKVFPTLDLHSVLFLNHTTPVGRIFDVFGNVDKPFYSLRFEAEEDIEKIEGLIVGADVFAVPTDPQLTAYVFVNDLFKLRGTDACGEDSLELPPELQDFSDDEKERQAKQEAQRRKRTHNHPAPALQGELGRSGAAGLILPPPRGSGDGRGYRASPKRGPSSHFPMVLPHSSGNNPRTDVMNSSAIALKAQSPSQMLPSVNTRAPPVTFPASAPSLASAQPLVTDPKTLPSAEVLFYNPKTDVTLASNKPKPSLFRSFMR